MDLFRRKQKLIFWIVTIIIVPSFVLVWGVDRFGGSNTADIPIGAVDGKSVSYPEFEGFQKRIRAALGGLPLQFNGAPGAGTPQEELYKYLFTYSLLQNAEKGGFTASDLQVGTYLENAHPAVSVGIDRNDPQSRERAVDAFCRQMQISRPEFLRGIREWQTIGNYLQADANLSVVNDETVYAFYSLNKAECVVKRLRFPESEALKEQAKQEIMARPSDELDADVRRYAADHFDRPAYREPARWRFAYVLTPFVAADSVMQPTEAEIRDRYEQGKSYLYNDSPLSDVRDRVRSELIQQEVERQTMRNITVDVDPQLRGINKDMSLDELVKLTPLVRYAVTAADTGPDALPAAEVVKKLPAGSEFQLLLLLGSIDGDQNIVNRDSVVEEWKSGFSQTGRPFRADDGYYRLQLLDYQPSTPAAIDGPDGKITPSIYESAIADMVGERAAEMARTQAEELEGKLRDYFAAREDSAPAPDAELAREFEAMPGETISYLQIADANYALGRLPIGDMMGPQAYRDQRTGETGQEIVVMVERRVPSREAFQAEPESTKNEYRILAGRNYRGDFGFTFTADGPTAIIQPSPTIMGGMADSANKGLLNINPELLRTNEG